MSKTHLLHKILHSLSAADTQEQKKEILSLYQNEHIVKRIIKTAYNPWIDLGLKDFKPRHMGKDFGMGISRFLHIIDDLIEHKLDQTEAEFACNMAFIHIDAADAVTFLSVLNQTLDVGLSVSTINSIWHDLVMDYPIRYAILGDAQSFDSFPAVVQPISTGLRVNIISHDNRIKYTQRDGTSISWSHFDDQFLNLSQGQGIVFDGHAVCLDDSGNVVTDHATILSAPEETIRFVLWDAIRHDGFCQGEDTRIGYNWRYNGIEHMMLLSADKNTDPCYGILPAEMVGNSEHLASAVEQMGNCVIKTMSATWKHGTTTDEIMVVA